ncbi:tyrosyl-DNA phosphodiesterase-domain-containing protein [Cokeromyces recurvatus]|uniref:tyrosyl-DNA phosphodiesterase-domain-containing protein n=1 Tax=Cokeromyces recurvatus TaxID=90255 RepID=UPI00221FC327|nr:tyrosyl-DNA phosphodiesterase-domain-containing protein [Cokeromyces recurvatus]KAI7901975.1 tyrosyl-DNA phosphodiesterase-domain-containing protein [Cokeromyces recurvatus]
MNSDDENEQIAKAMALSLQGLDSQLRQEQKEKDDLRKAIAASLGKKVEELTARDMLLAETTNPPLKRPREEDENDDVNVLPTHRILKRLNNSEARFWDGVIKLTYVKGFIGPDYIRFEDIIQKHDLKKALITAFVCSLDFINDNFPLDVNLCIVTHGRPAIKKQIHPHRIIIQPPLKNEKYGVFHPKLMLLFRDSSVRIVIGSANMERYDYEDLENVVFIQDFPRLKTPHKTFSELPRFARDICDLLDHMQVPNSVKEELLKYDYNKAKAHIVASISGTFEGEEEYRKYGHTRLADIINEIVGPINDSKLLPKVEMQTSSLGALSLSYLNELYRSFCGIESYSKEKPILITKKNELPPIDIIYPTKDTVESSRLGPSGAGTICLNSNTWKKPTFPKQIMCDSISQRQGTLMHSKYIIATLPSTFKSSKFLTESNLGKLRGWMYCGSHNATVSAWGKFTVSRDTKKPKMNISNWELGVVLPIFEKSDFPAPYLRPAPRYQSSQEAWTQNMEW